MKTTTKSHINPINRDIAILVTIGFIIALGIVTAGIFVLSQL